MNCEHFEKICREFPKFENDDILFTFLFFVFVTRCYLLKRLLIEFLVRGKYKRMLFTTFHIGNFVFHLDGETKLNVMLDNNHIIDNITLLIVFGLDVELV